MQRKMMAGHRVLLEKEFGGWFATCSCGWRGWAIEASRAAANWDFSLHLDDLAGDRVRRERLAAPASSGRSPAPVKLHVLPPLYSRSSRLRPWCPWLPLRVGG